MKIRRIRIERFRGIKELQWDVGGDFMCLIGPGDSTKSTILDAIELALSPRWNVQFDDTDFYNAKTDEPIKITITVGDLPDEFKSDAKYGYLTRGWSNSGELHDEPEDNDELVLSIQLSVEPSLEQSWAVVNDRNPEGKQITAKDREKLACARLGDYLDRHFSWSRGSILSRLTGDADSVASILADAGRAARAALDDAPSDNLPKLRQAALEAKRVGAEFGVAATSDYRPYLDVQAVSVGLGGLSLHDGAVPLRRAGLGTRRLLAVAMQREVAKAGGITVIDEIEHGLEPHRIRHLLRVLRGANDQQRSAQVFMTTHAPVVLGELDADQLRVVRINDGVTSVQSVDTALQPIIRKVSEAFLARKVMVCEGKTELGLCRRLDQWWGTSGTSFGFAGIALADGEGSNAPLVAKSLADLGYRVALLGDSDKPLNPDRLALESVGVRVVLWAGGMALEERIACDLPWEGVAAVVRLAMDIYGEQNVRDAIAHRMEIAATEIAGPPLDWRSPGCEESKLRRAIGVAAQKHKVGNRTGWFKRVELAEDLAGIVIEHFDAILNTDLGQKIVHLREWAHGDG